MRQKRHIGYESDEDFEPRSKKERNDDKLDLLHSEVANIKDSVNEMMTLSADSQLPLGLKRIIF